MAATLKWNRRLKDDAVDRLRRAVEEIDLRIEAEAKRQLYPGHGVVTGTLRRSIHAAEPTYSWRMDNVKPDAHTPEMGGREFRAEVTKIRITGCVGSGLEYAMAVHQGHHSFEGYHYLTRALEIVRPSIRDIIKRHLR